MDECRDKMVIVGMPKTHLKKKLYELSDISPTGSIYADERFKEVRCFCQKLFRDPITYFL